MHYVGIPLAMLVMFVAQRIEARLGVAAAGWFAALPVSFAVATASIAVGVGYDTAAAVAISAIGHVGPMILYGVVFVRVAPSAGMLRGFFAATAAYAAFSAVLVGLHPLANVGVSVLALVAGNLYQSRQPKAPIPALPPTRLQRGLSLLSAGAVVAVLTVSNQFFGPALAGALGAFPIMSTTIAFANAPREGAANAVSVYQGVARSLPIYLVYGLSFALALGVMGTFWAVTTAVACALATAALMRRVPITRQKTAVPVPS